MLSQQDIDIINKSVLFKKIPDDITRELLDGSIKRVIPRGKTLFIQGEAAANLFVMIEGWVKLTRITPAGDEIVLTVYTAGESFGEAAALQGGIYPVTAQAVSDSEILSVKAATILHTLKTRPELVVAMLSCTYQHLHELVIQIESMKALSSAQRLAAFLIALAPVGEGSCAFALPYDKALMAGRLGMKPESLSRAFARLRERGVMVSRTNIAIADVARLRDYIVEEKSEGWQKIGS